MKSIFTVSRRAVIVVLLCASVVPAARLRAQVAQVLPGGGLGLLDAVRTSLDLQPDIQSQIQQVEISRGDLRAAEGQFDTVLSGGVDGVRSQLPNTGLQELQGLGLKTVTSQASYTLSFQKQLRNGFTLMPSAQVVRSNNNLLPLAANRSVVGFTAIQPLQRGRGSVVTAFVRAGESGVRASEQDLRQTRSGSALRTVIAYWNYVAAVRRLDIYQGSEGRSQQLTEQIRTLINAGNRPAADIKQLQANLNDRRATRLAGEQNVVEARQQLGLAMGLLPEQIDALPGPSDSFPVVPAEDPPSAVGALQDLAVARRADLAALAERQLQADTLITAARDQLKPQLNLQLSGGYAGLDEGANLLKLFTPFQRSGANVQVTMNYQWSRANNSALGALARTAAARQQTGIARADLVRNVRSGVEVALSDVRSSAAQVRSVRDSGALYREAVDDEREKQQLGLSTVIDLIVTEDRLTNSLLNELAAEFNYAVAIAQLRFQTDTLIPAAGNSVDYESLTTVVPVTGR